MNSAPNDNGLRRVLRAGLGAPLLLLAVLSMVVLPLPPLVLDTLFTFNIALALVVLMAVVYVARPLEFGVFPTVMLIATLLRLALNVASTRVILLHGHTGTASAGHVVESFGEFVVGGNFAVGLVVFAILTIVNFVVVTKGAGRISEVSARFTLDAMPGRQMAIDADLSAGLITQEEARVRRGEVRAEADFYGSMDGASTFVRGDAVAGILVVIINLVGGIAIGMLSHDLDFGQAGRTYALLTIGDGLVAQIPALLLSTAVAIIVTRMSQAQDMGNELSSQLFAQPRVLGATAALLAIMGVVPGMPNAAFLTMSVVTAAGAWWLARRAKVPPEPAEPESLPAAPPVEMQELSWDDVRPVDPISLEVGYRLVPLVDRAQGGELLGRIRGVRRKLSQELGFLVQAVHIRDNVELPPGDYRICVGGVVVGQGSIHADRELAINPGRVFGKVPGIETREPTFGMPAIWIEPAQREQAQSFGYTVVDPSTVVATHLSQLVQIHSHQLLGYEETQQLLASLARTAPKLVEELTPKTLAMSVVVRVLQSLLAERVALRNLRLIVETLVDQGRRTQDPTELLAQVRIALGPQIVHDVAGSSEEVPVITLEPDLEDLLHGAVAGSGTPVIEPGLAERLQQRLKDSVARQDRTGEPTVLVVSPQLRAALARFARATVPGLNVWAWNELPESRRVRLAAAIGR
jgi:flagellar biosynthesis protein FlhA